MNPAAYEVMTISQRYELGRSDGFADGSYTAQWTPALVHDELATFPDRLRIAREGRQECAYFSAKYPERYDSARAWQAYTVGFARGFREGVADYAAGFVHELCDECDGKGHYTTWPHTTCPTCEGSGLTVDGNG